MAARTAHFLSWLLFAFVLAGSLIYVFSFAVESREPDLAFLIDDFEGDEIHNLLGGRANVYVKAPSRIMIARAPGNGGGESQALLIRYDKENSGGPYDGGGWCGYYTLLKDDRGELDAGGSVYFDASRFKALTFWVRGEKGDENFMIGLADRHWDKVGDSLKSEEIAKFLPQGELTTEWQRAIIPLDTFFLDHTQLASISICFDSDCFFDAQHEGVVYVDDIGLL